MAIFGILKTEPILQVNDKTRLDASKTFVSKDEAAITALEIEPEAGAGFIDVFDANPKNWFLDWSYSGTTRTITCTVRVTTDGAPVNFTQVIQIKTATDDKLFSTDADILDKRQDLLNWLKPGRSSFLNFHRQARDLILSRLDDEGKTDRFGNKMTADMFIDKSEVREVAAYWTLALIFQNLSNAVGDVFERDSKAYYGDVQKKWNKAFLRFDVDQDGELNEGEGDFSFGAIQVIRE